MHSEDEANIIKAGAKGKKVLALTRRRSSKVVYQSESVRPGLERTSSIIKFATKFVLTGEKMASENYQVMNYGMGGTIKVHTDVEEGLNPLVI